MAEVSRGVDPERLCRAVLAYGRDPSAWGASGRPLSAHKLILDGRYDAFLDVVEPAAMAERAASVAGWPEGLREAVAAEKGRAFAASYLDGCAWSAGERTLTPRTSMAFERLRDQVGEVLGRFEVTLRRPVAGAAAMSGLVGETV